MKHFSVVIILSLALWSFGWITQKSISGERPTRIGAPSAARDAIYEDAALLRLRTNVESAPEDIGGWRALASAISEKMRSATPRGEDPPQDLALELLDVFGEILRLAPDDPQTLLSMANLSFNLTAFSKAVELYERYLRRTPGDDEARATYASALMFMGRGNDAIKELREVVERNPTIFQPRALLAVAFAQLGRHDEAKIAGDAALELAPSEEAQSKLLSFLNDAALRGEDSQELPEVESALANVVRGSSVAGPKFVRVERTNAASIVIRMKDFPMEAMPPFARDKFVQSLSTAAANARFEGTLTIVDDATNREMHRLTVGGVSSEKTPSEKK